MVFIKFCVFSTTNHLLVAAFARSKDDTLDIHLKMKLCMTKSERVANCDNKNFN